MKLRKATLTDYGVPPDDIPTLQSHLRNLSESDKYNLLQVSIKYAPGIESQIYDSIERWRRSGRFLQRKMTSTDISVRSWRNIII